MPADLINDNGHTPHSLAIQYQQLEVVKLLLGQEDVAINAKNQQNQTPLSQVARDGYKEVVKLLLEREE
jgi:ankyrin repeat protein